MELKGNARFVFGKKSGFSVGRRARLGARDIAAKPERVELAIVERPIFSRRATSDICPR